MKNNRNSIWVKTVTISPVNGLLKNSHHNTYPLAFGPKNSSHESIEKRFQEDLAQLNNGSERMYYYGKTKSMYRVHAELVVSIQDQPERRAENHVALGSSNFTAQWGYLMNANQMSEKLIPCKTCEGVLFSNIRHRDILSKLSLCTNCVSWDYTSKRKVLKTIPPEKYPTRHNNIYGKVLYPKEQTFKQLIEATDMVHNKRVHKVWNKLQARAFMQTEGINVSTQIAILFHAANCTVDDNLNNESPCIQEMVNREKLINPASFEKWTCSAWTRDIEIWQHIEAVMHLVFHGIQKTNMILIETWASWSGSLSALQRFGNQILQNIQDLNLDWCKVIPYNGGKFGGWMAENFLGMSRINAWFYSTINTFAIEKKYDGDPKKCQSKWTKTQNMAWLRARGLTLNAKDNARSISSSVATYLLQDTIPPILTPSSFTAEDLQDLVVHATKMITLVMNRYVDDEYLDELDISIKVFLTKFNKFDNNMKMSEKEKPRWVTSYNYLCLLNLPRIAKNFGPLRNLWEGGYIGEGFLRLIKPHITRGLGKNWQKNIHRGILERKVFNQLCDSYMISNNASIKKYHLYHDVNTLTIQFVNNTILSCIYTTQEEFLFVFKDKSVILMEVSDLNIIHNSMYYFNMKLSKYYTNTYQYTIDSYCLLLPRLNKNGIPNELCNDIDNSNTVFTMVNSEWKHLGNDKKLH